MRLRSTVLGCTVLAAFVGTSIPSPAAAAHRHSRHAGHAHHARYARLQCVPFARNESGVEIKGNAVTWWGQADGVYERGHTPEVGSVLSFQSSGRMPLGHVAVVASVISHREIEIDHANWGGGIHRNVSVVDVSDRNDWTELRVETGQSGDFGAVYAANGFIYDRAAGAGAPMPSGASSVMVASAAATRPMSVSPLLAGRPTYTLPPPLPALGTPVLTFAAADPEARDPMEVAGRDPFETFRTPWHGTRHVRPAREAEEVAELPSKKRHRRRR